VAVGISGVLAAEVQHYGPTEALHDEEIHLDDGEIASACAAKVQIIEIKFDCRCQKVIL
jgi:hypothetical protein